jgi:hypothetical protein
VAKKSVASTKKGGRRSGTPLDVTQIRGLAVDDLGAMARRLSDVADTMERDDIKTIPVSHFLTATRCIDLLLPFIQSAESACEIAVKGAARKRLLGDKKP